MEINVFKLIAGIALSLVLTACYGTYPGVYGHHYHSPRYNGSFGWSSGYMPAYPQVVVPGWHGGHGHHHMAPIMPFIPPMSHGHHHEGGHHHHHSHHHH
jgi:hypothetical protein